MRLAHFVEQGAVVGGVERYLADLLAVNHPTLSHAVVLNEGDRCAFAGPWPVTTVPWSADGRRSASPQASLERSLAGLDAVCVFHYPPSEEAVSAARRAGIPVAMFCHDHRWWCASATRYHALTGRACGIRASTPACAWRYYPLHCGGRRPSAMMRGLSRAAVGRRAVAAADAVLAASAFMAAQAALHGAASPRTHVVPLPTTFASPPPPRAASQPPVVLCASRLTPEKGVETLLDAFALLRVGAILEIAGTGIAAGAIAGAVARHPCAGRIRLLGQLEGGKMRDAYARAAAVVVPSRWPEPFGLVGVEALAAARPVISTGVGGTADWSRGDLGVLIVPPGRPAALADALERALTEPLWAERARSAGAPWVAARHGIIPHLARLLEVLGPLGKDGSP